MKSSIRDWLKWRWWKAKYEYTYWREIDLWCLMIGCLGIGMGMGNGLFGLLLVLREVEQIMWLGGF